MHRFKMFSDDQHVMLFAAPLQLTQQTYFITRDKIDSIPPMSASKLTHFKQQPTADEWLSFRGDVARMNWRYGQQLRGARGDGIIRTTIRHTY